MVTIVCVCRYPLVFIDTRNGDSISYISIPEEVFEDEGGIDNPEFEEIAEEGFDGEMHDYMAVIWKNPEDAITKKYDVNEHIVISGCDASTDGKKMKCKKKELYVVLHQIQEWIDNHIIEIK